MRYFAKENGYDEDFWEIAGLLHDVDLNNIQKNIVKKHQSY